MVVFIVCESAHGQCDDIHKIKLVTASKDEAVRIVDRDQNRLHFETFEVSSASLVPH